jgi:branched-chain amino acid transport system substrate-binding protein
MPGPKQMIGKDVMYRFKIATAVVTGALAVALGACGSDSSSGAKAKANGGSGATTASTKAAAPAIAAGPIVIGAPLGLTGFVSFYDGPLLAGAKLAVKEINSGGGVLGHPLKLVTADTKSDPAQIANAGTAVLDKGAKFVIPTMDYDFGGPAARVASAKKIISITTSGDPRMGLKGIGPYAFNLYPAGPTEGAAAATFAYDKQGWRSIYILNDTSANHPKTVCAAFKRTFTQLGGTIAGEDTFLNKDQSIATQLTRMRAALPKTQAIMLCSFPPGGVNAVRQVRGAGIDKPLILDAAFDGTFWLAAIPKENNTYVMSTGSITRGQNHDPEQERVLAAYTADAKKPPVFGVGLMTGYSAVQALAKAITAANSIDSDAVKRQLESFNDTALAIGHVTYSTSCHVPLGAPLSVLRINRGKQKFVATVTGKDVSRAIC